MTSGSLAGLKRVALAFVFLCSGAGVVAQVARPQHAHISLISDQHGLAAPGSQWIGLRFQLDPGWHIYWTNPGDSGEPPKVAWHLPSGFQAGDLQFPFPHRIQDHGLTDYGYEGDVVLLSKLTIPAGAASNKAEIGADVRYLVCREVCVPAKDHVSLSLVSSRDTKSSPDAELIRGAHARLPQPFPPGVRVFAALQATDIIVTVMGKNPNLGAVADFVPSDTQVIENSAKPVIENSSGVLRIRLKKSEQLDHPVRRLRGLLISGDNAYDVDATVTPAKNSQRGSVPKHN
ncbi:MAG TPA: protein-disulfide reductase DsbD domain-containing protein [Terriglobales bacterium]|nr:protein-disulfide reductase DsbD domain-containing protein [Terriglobales bacterium]